ncbi:MAG: replication-associated recombination protein A [Candidatus Riflebacteria bacterium]|nr:replication-associated recombination protein A [Candidatus Riflebacteria bacterium]
MAGLFDFHDEKISSGNASVSVYQPLADRVRPTSLEDVMGQDDILGPDKPLRMLMEAGLSGSIILWGPPGCGKTTLARVLAGLSDSDFIQLSAVTSGVKEMKAAFDQAAYTRKTSGRKTILFIDEIHRFNKAQQDALLPHIESGLVIFIGATTENPSFEVNSALLSRCQVLVLKSISVPALITILARAIEKDDKLNREPKIDISDDSIERIAMMAAGDARIALNVLETCCEVSRQKTPEKPVVTPEIVAETFQSKLLRYDKGGEEHYNLISALHKSLRGSDPDAALYWAYRMIDGGENCRYLFRRMIRFAAEDIGMADPFAMTLAMSCAQAFEYVGPPEAHLFVAQLVVYLATAPKSNALYKAESRVKRYIREIGEPGVPIHLRNAPTKLMQELGYGKEYRYPHDYKGAFLPDENYFPMGCEPISFYLPTSYGKEKAVKERLDKLWPNRYKNGKFRA